MARLSRGNWASGTFGSPIRASGAYQHPAGTQTGWWIGHYAGEFFINTGFDDPVPHTPGLEGAEVWGARVYSRISYLRGNILPNGAATGSWRIKATPLWSAQHYVAIPGTPVNRVIIHCEVWLSEPPNTSDGMWYSLNEVAWTLYRL